MARPRNLTDEQVEQLIEQFNEYIDTTDIPIIAEFAYTHDITRQTLYDYVEFSTLIKKCIDKKEAELEKRGLFGDVNPTMAIFSLKQLGWKDKTENKVTINTNELSDEEINELLSNED